MANPSMERAQVALGCKVQHARDLLYALVPCAFDAPTETQGFHYSLLYFWLLHQVRDPRIPKKLDQTVFELSQHCKPG